MKKWRRAFFGVEDGSGFKFKAAVFHVITGSLTEGCYRDRLVSILAGHRVVGMFLLRRSVKKSLRLMMLKNGSGLKLLHLSIENSVVTTKGRYRCQLVKIFVGQRVANFFAEALSKEVA